MGFGPSIFYGGWAVVVFLGLDLEWAESVGVGRIVADASLIEVRLPHANSTTNYQHGSYPIHDAAAGQHGS